MVTITQPSCNRGHDTSQHYALAESEIEHHTARGTTAFVASVSALRAKAMLLTELPSYCHRKGTSSLELITHPSSTRGAPSGSAHADRPVAKAQVHRKTHSG
jgi:hypothetical protein